MQNQTTYTNWDNMDLELDSRVTQKCQKNLEADEEKRMFLLFTQAFNKYDYRMMADKMHTEEINSSLR